MESIIKVDKVIKKFGSDIALNNVSIIIETPGFLSSYSGYKNLEYLASIKSIIGKKK